MNVKKCTQSNRHHYTFHDSRDRGGKVAKKSHKYCLKEGGGGLFETRHLCRRYVLFKSRSITPGYGRYG